MDTTGREPKPPIAVTIGAAQAAGAGAKYISTCAGAAQDIIELAQCTPQLALETRTLQEQARRNRQQAYVQPLFRSAQAPWCDALPRVRGKQLSDRRCPLNPGEQEEAELPTVLGKQIE